MTRKQLIGTECSVKDIQLVRVGIGEFPMFPDYPFTIADIVSLRGKQYYDLSSPGTNGVVWRVLKDLVTVRKEV